MRSPLSSLAVLALAVPANELACLGLSASGTRSPPRSRSLPPAPILPGDDASSSLPRILLAEEALLERAPTKDETEEKETDEGADVDELPPFLRGMVDEQRELQRSVGRAMDVLRGDYPYFLRRAPDFSIYHDSVVLSASDGQVQLSNLPSYKRAFGVARTMLSLLYDADRSVVQNRMFYDTSQCQIRVSFNAMLVPKLGPLAMRRAVHVDGISIYSIDLSPAVKRDDVGNPEHNEGAGKIVEHRIERLLVNGAELRPPYFDVHAWALELAGQRAGALAGAGAWS